MKSPITIKHASFQNSYSLMAVKNQTSILVCNKFKLGKKWKFNVSHQGTVEDFPDWDSAKAEFDKILLSLTGVQNGQQGS